MEYGHLKPCDRECQYRSTSGICQFGGWNMRLGCWQDWMAQQAKRRAEREKQTSKVDILNIGYRLTKHADKDVERKKIEQAEKWSSEFGRAAIRVVCPFCNYPLIAYIWSFAAIGKRCNGCGAILIGGYHWEARRKNA